MKKKFKIPVQISFFTKKEQKQLIDVVFRFFDSHWRSYEEQQSAPIPEELAKRLTFLSFIPFIRHLYLVNSCSFGVKHPSDYDLFFVVDSRFLFVTRAIVSVLFHFLGLRRHGKKIQNRFCLSFWIAEGVNTQDYYHRDHLDLYFMLWDHLKKEVPLCPWKGLLWVEKLPFWNLLEKISKKIQILKFKRFPYRHEDGGLILDHHILKFHEKDRRRFYYDQWLALLEKEAPNLYAKIKLYEI